MANLGLGKVTRIPMGALPSVTAPYTWFQVSGRFYYARATTTTITVYTPYGVPVITEDISSLSMTEIHALSSAVISGIVCIAVCARNVSETVYAISVRYTVAGTTFTKLGSLSYGSMSPGLSGGTFTYAFCEVVMDWYGTPDKFLIVAGYNTTVRWTYALLENTLGAGAATTPTGQTGATSGVSPGVVGATAFNGNLYIAWNAAGTDTIDLYVIGATSRDSSATLTGSNRFASTSHGGAMDLIICPASNVAIKCSTGAEKTALLSGAGTPVIKEAAVIGVDASGDVYLVATAYSPSGTFWYGKKLVSGASAFTSWTSQAFGSYTYSLGRPSPMPHKADWDLQRPIGLLGTGRAFASADPWVDGE